MKPSLLGRERKPEWLLRAGRVTMGREKARARQN
jgi:hypothetical protein